MPRRRAMLAVALGFALLALVASLASRPREESAEEPPQRPVPREAAGGGTEMVAFDAARARTRSVEAGSRVVLSVEVPEPGQVVVPSFGLTAAAQAGTPASFDVLADDPGRHEVLFQPVEGEERPAGTLVVVARR